MNVSFLFLCFVILIVQCYSLQSASMDITNMVEQPVELFWIDAYNTNESERYVKLSSKPIIFGANAHINSFESHQFEIRFENHRPGTEIPFSKLPYNEIVRVRFDESKNQLTLERRPETEVVTDEGQSLIDKLNNLATVCSEYEGKETSKCIADGIVNDVVKLSDEQSTLTKYRNKLSYRLRNYTCADPEITTSDAISRSYLPVFDQEYLVDTLLDLENAKVWMAHDFISPSECEILMNHARPKLRRATVAAEDGTSIVSENRKAQQARYYLNETDRESDVLYPLFMRVMEMTRVRTGLELYPEGQEDFTVIQYNPGDQYTPHCDGQCDGEKFINKGRVATAVLYCSTAGYGGGTSFSKANVFVNPVEGSGAFFSYKGLSGLMDEGYTEHSGCPVYDGEKWIAVVWMREGVSNEEPWHWFDPSGIRILDENELKIAKEHEEKMKADKEKGEEKGNSNELKK